MASIVAMWFAAQGETPAWSQQALAPHQRSHVVIIKPVILCDDDGQAPAPFMSPKEQLDEIFADAGLEVVFLEPIRWHFGQAKRGETTRDELLSLGKASRIICRDERIVSMIFGAALDTLDQESQGRRNSNACFIDLGEQNSETSSDKVALLMERKLRRCLKLSNLEDGQLDGSPSGSRFDAVERSPRVVDRLRFHSSEEGRRLIVDESWEPYISAGTDDFLRFSIGLKADAPIPQQADAKRRLIEQRYTEKVLEFTEPETKALADVVEQLNELVGNDWPCISRLPWHFVKVDQSFCSGFPHTRGLTIYLTPRVLSGIAGRSGLPMGALSLLLHEKLHIVQRLNASRFETLYKGYGFRPIQLANGEAERINFALNPDALNLNWALDLSGTPSMMVTVFRTTGDGTLRFTNQYRSLEEQPNGEHIFGPVIEKTPEFDQWQSKLPSGAGLEHPNELAAYLSLPLFVTDYLSVEQPPMTAEQQQSIDLTRTEFKRILRVGGVREVQE